MKKIISIILILFAIVAKSQTIEVNVPLDEPCEPDLVFIGAIDFPSGAGLIMGEGVYSFGEDITLNTLSSEGFTFVNWTEDGIEVSNEAVYSFTVSEDRVLTANFSLNEYEITTLASPEEGGTTSGNGTYDYGETVTITAEANTGYTFINWTEDGTEVSPDEEYSFTVSEDRALTANFSLNEYEITTLASPEEGGSTSGDGIYDYGETVEISAVAEEGYTFINWTEDGSSVSNNENYNFMATGNRLLTAIFSQNEYVITTESNPADGGTTTGAGGYNYGETATVTATTNTGYAFINWTEDGAEVSPDEEYSFTATEDQALIANFEIDLGVPNIELSDIQIYPNPFKNSIYIKSHKKRIEKIQIFDSLGKLIVEQSGKDRMELEIQTQTMSSGIYFINIYTNKGNGTFKIIKE